MSRANHTSVTSSAYSNSGAAVTPLFNKAYIVTRSRRVDTSGDVWQIGESTPIILNWDALSSLPKQLVSEIKYAFKYYLEKLSPLTVYNVMDVLKRFALSVDDWDEESPLSEQLSEYIFDFIIANRRHSDESPLNHLRHWYRRSHKLGLSLFERKTCDVLARLSFKGNIKGLDVMVYMKDRSPLRSHELKLVREALTECRQQITPYDMIFHYLVITWIYVILGVRPRQLLLLMASDLIVNVDEETGQKNYLLNVPSVKKRHELPRTRFKSRVLPHFLGEMLEQVIAYNYGDLFRTDVTGKEEQHLLFITPRKTSRQLRQATFERYENALSSSSFSNAPSLVLDFINKHRVARGKAEIDIKLTARRLRKTFATHAASMGTSAVQLMDLLDHDDLQHVMVYYQLGVNFAIRVDDVYQQYFSEHMAYFQGDITLKELVERKNIHTVYGPDSLQKLVGIGLCAKGTPCSLQPPYSCYSCNKFEATNDVSVHQEVLAAMQNEVREKFGDDVPPGFYAASHIKACDELVRSLEVGHE
ncbi:hypothetical protein [Alishewanella sp. HL-SH05]|uniref:hypothetical protein n=1 Tax=Alishewanella sp. HL-SH05 TaxID=3461145 RepID=UPI00404246D9